MVQPVADLSSIWGLIDADWVVGDYGESAEYSENPVQSLM